MPITIQLAMLGHRPVTADDVAEAIHDSTLEQLAGGSWYDTVYDLLMAGF